MGIPKKKRQLVRRSYPKLSVGAIAARTELSEAQVKEVLKIDRQEEHARKAGQWDNLLGWAIVCCVFAAPFVMIPGLRDAANLAQNAFVQVTAILLAGVWVVKQTLVEKKLVLVSSPLVWPLAGLALWCLVSLFWAVNRFEVVLVFVQIFAMAMFYQVVVQACVKDAESSVKDSETGRPAFHLPDKIITALVLAGWGIALIGICQYLFGFSLIPQARPPAATFANRNMASQFMVLVIPLGLYVLARSQSSAMIWLSAAGTCLMMVYVVYIQSLAGWVAVFLELILFGVVLGYFSAKNRISLVSRSTLVPLTAMVAVFLVLINVNAGGVDFRFGGGY